MEDGQNTKTDKAQTTTTKVKFELIFPLLLLQPGGKLRETLISIWRIRILVFQYYGIIPLQTYWVMTLLVTLALPKAMGTLPMCTQDLGPTWLGPRRTQSCSCPTDILP